MSADSPLTPHRPPARTRVRPAPPLSVAASPLREEAQDTSTPVPSLIGNGPRQYLLGCEDRASFDSFKAALDAELSPADPIERMWVDEVVDLEWDLHRLRSARRAVVEKGVITSLVELVSLSEAGSELMAASRGMTGVTDVVWGCVRGDPQSREVVSEAIGADRIEEVLQDEWLKTIELQARLEQSIHATSRLRDAVLSRVYSRRQIIENGRITSGSGQ